MKKFFKLVITMTFVSGIIISQAFASINIYDVTQQEVVSDRSGGTWYNTIRYLNVHRFDNKPLSDAAPGIRSDDPRILGSTALPPFRDHRMGARYILNGTYTLLTPEDLQPINQAFSNYFTKSEADSKFSEARSYTDQLRTYTDQKISELNTSTNAIKEGVDKSIKELAKILVTNEIIEEVSRRISEQLTKDMASMKEQVKAEVLEAMKDEMKKNNR